jgi:hypothetical protein
MGRASLIMVMGFNIIFATMGFTISNVADWAYKNYVDYYYTSVARQMAGSAANIAATEITFSPNWRTGFSDISFQGGTYSISVSSIDSFRIRVDVMATYGEKYGLNRKVVSYPETLVLGLTQFSKFAYFSNSEGSIQWAKGDTVWGPFHTQDRITTTGNPGPVFEGRATSLNGLTRVSGSTPSFLGGYQNGVNIPLPTNFSNLRSSCAYVPTTQGRLISGRSGGVTRDVYMTLNADGSVTYRFNSWTSAVVLTAPISTFAPNGVVCVDSANIHLKGILNGRLTISCIQGSSATTSGNVYFDSSVVYKTKVGSIPESTDMLGIVTDNNCWIKDTIVNHPSSPQTGFTVCASMLCRTGGFGAQNYASLPLSGMIHMVGGVQQNQRQAVGTTSGGTVDHGYNKDYRYDNRLMVNSPPLYPTTGNYEVLSWYE